MRRTDAAAEHARKLDLALLELAGRDADPAHPPRSALRALARLGLRVRPVQYYGIIGASVCYTLLLAPLTGVGLWLLVWRHDAVRPLPMITGSLQIGLVLGVATALLSWALARLRRLSRWEAL